MVRKLLETVEIRVVTKSNQNVDELEMHCFPCLALRLLGAHPSVVFFRGSSKEGVWYERTEKLSFNRVDKEGEAVLTMLWNKYPPETSEPALPAPHKP